MATATETLEAELLKLAPAEQARLRGFPYTVAYRGVEDEVSVLVVRHQHRHPDFGTRRQ